MKRPENQSGFSAVAGLLVVLAIVVVSGAGWLVYQHNRVKISNAAATNSPTSNQQPPATQPTQSTPVASQNVIKIPELGIQITVPDDIKDLTYQTSTVKLSPNGNQATLAMFSTASLATADASCGPQSMAVGSLEKASGQYPSDDPYAGLDYGVLVKQFPTFYISRNGEHSLGCSGSKSIPAAASKYSSDFVSSLSTIAPSN